MSEATMTRRERVARAIVDSHVAIHGVTWPAMSEIQQSWYLECADVAIAAYEAALADMTRRERVARAIYDAPNGIDGDQLADMLIENDRIYGDAEVARQQVMRVCLHAADAAIAAYEAALAEEGLVIVPREATKGMIDAGHDPSRTRRSDNSRQRRDVRA